MVCRGLQYSLTVSLELEDATAGRVKVGSKRSVPKVRYGRYLNRKGGFGVELQAAVKSDLVSSLGVDDRTRPFS